MIFKALVNNIALLIALSIIHNLFIRRLSARPLAQQVLSGLLFGAVTLAGMRNPFELAPGLIFDGRSIIISTAGLIGGPLTASITMIISALYRIWLGGSGAIMGVSVITASWLIGIGYHYYRQRHPEHTRLVHLWIFGMIVHLAMLGLMLTLPSNLTLLAVQSVGGWVVTLYPVGQVLVCVLFLDQEARQLAEAARRESEQRYQSLIENMLEGYARVSLDGKILDFNEAYRQMTGYEAGELRGMTFQELTLDEYHSVEAKIIEEQVMPRGYSDLYFKKYRRKDGGVIPLEIRVYLERDPDGRPAYLLGMMRDVSERQEAEEKFQKAFMNNPAMILISDRNTDELVEVNNTFLNMTGVERSAAVGKNLFSFQKISPELHAALSRDLAEKGCIRNAELEISTRNGGALTVLLSIDLLELHGRRMLLIVMQDISERRRTEELIRQQKERLEDQNEELIAQSQRLVETQEELRQLNAGLEQRVSERTLQLQAANQELEAFAYSVSHDLRAPLRTLSGFSKMLIEDHGEKLEGEARNYLQRIDAASTRMSHLIDDLLKLSRITRGELNLSPVDLSALARQVVEETASGKTRRLVEWHIHPGMSAQADIALVKIALQNLLGNAYKFTAGKVPARVEFGQEQKDGARVFFVRDNGVGFDMEYVDKLFAPFQRLHRPDEFEGSGIGLAIVARIIHRHGGKVWGESRPGEGAVFYFTLPPAD